MGAEIVELNCPGCGARVQVSQKICEYCNQPVVISTIGTLQGMTPLDLNKYKMSYQKALAENPNNFELNKSLAFCFFKLKLYDQAKQKFEKAIEANVDDAEAYFYTAICTLKGRKPFLCDRETIDKVLEYMDAASALDTQPLYLYFIAYVKYDYFARKHYNIEPDYKEMLEQVETFGGLSELDKTQFFEMLGVTRPEEL